MKKLFISTLLQISILSFIATHTLAMDKIIKEYPELTSFFDSTTFKELLGNFEVVAEYSDPKMSNHIASFDFEFGFDQKYKFQRRISINSHYINKDLFNAEEFKFVLCHELGHLHDKNSLKKLLITSLGFVGVIGGASYFTLQSLFKKEWDKSCNRAIIGLGLCFLVKLVVMKFARNSELFADEYSLNLTKNKDAAISALQKRKIYNKSTLHTFIFINYLQSLFASHPCEDDRIANLEKKSLY